MGVHHNKGEDYKINFSEAILIQWKLLLGKCHTESFHKKMCLCLMGTTMMQISLHHSAS